MDRKVKLLALFTVMMLIALACSVTAPKDSEPDAAVPAEDTPTAAFAPVEKPVETGEEVQPVAEPTAEPAVDSTLPPIVHTNLPDATLPKVEPRTIHDHESIRRADEKQAYSGDVFLISLFERPFDPEMNYIPFIDIKQANLYDEVENQFIYTSILFMDDPTLLPDGRLGIGVELDLDRDGRGDTLIWTKLPVKSEWSVEGVRVMNDGNEDVGGPTPMLSDEPAGGDGYEVSLFNAGIGKDPDLAWSRISPDDPMRVEIAFKRVVLEENKTFLWAAWSILKPEQMDIFDHNDHFTFEQAGSAMKSDGEYYPLKELYAMDNTCRAASGFTPLGSEPGLCPISPIVEDQANCRRVCVPYLSHLGCHWETICD